MNNKNNNFIDEKYKNIHIPTPLEDSFQHYNTKNILYGNFKVPPNDYVKNIIVSVIKSYSLDDTLNITENDNEWKKFFKQLYKRNENYNYDDLLKLLTTNEQPTAEYILSAALYAYKNQDPELLTRTLNTFCRPVKLNGKNEWLDNWSLNGPGNALNFIFWHDYDNDNIITLSKTYKYIKNNYNINIINEKEAIKESMKETGGSRKLKKTKQFITQKDIKDCCNNSNLYSLYVLKIVGIFRAFLICNDLLPLKVNKTEFDLKDISDISVKYFPSYYVGCGGCDMFNNEIAPTIETIKKFISEYKNISVMAIINASPYWLGDGGSHWMGLYLSDDKCLTSYLMCPQASGWDVLKDRGNLELTLKKLGFSLENNIICCQKDDCNCGVYSLLFLLMMLINNGDMLKAVKSVGENADNIPHKDKTTDDFLIYTIKNTIFGYK